MSKSKYGSFSGNPKTEWLVTENGIDQDMVLLEDFLFEDPDGKPWKAPATFPINGASIPRQLWTLIGSPFVGNYRRASIVHDIACGDATTKEERKAADVMFFYACLAGDCKFFESAVLYVGVRIGAWIDSPSFQASLSEEKRSFLQSGKRLSDDKFIKNKFLAIYKKLEADKKFRSPVELDELIDRYIEF